MKLINIEEVINGRTISGTTDKSDDNGVNTESSNPSNIKGENTKEKNESTVIEIPKVQKGNNINLFPYGSKVGFIVFGLSIILSVSIAFLCTRDENNIERYVFLDRYTFKWSEFDQISSILFIILYGVAVWGKNAVIKFIDTFKPRFGKGYNRLLIVSFILIPCIIAFIFYIIEGFEEFLSALLIAYAIECILYISVLWVYMGFKEEQNINKEKENINNKNE